MDLIFVLLTQLINLTPLELGFEVDTDRRLLPKLLKGKTRFVKQSRILRRIRNSEPGWKIRVLIEGEFSGIELDPLVLLDFVRVVFRIEEKEEDRRKWNVLCVDGVLENHGSDFLLRHRYFGWRRDYYWNRRPLISIDRSDSCLAAKLRRRIDGDCRYLSPFANDASIHRRESSTYASPRKGNPAKNNIPIYHKYNKLEEEIPKDRLLPKSPRVTSDRPNGTATPQGKIPKDRLLPKSSRVTSNRPNGTAKPQGEIRKDSLLPKSPQVTSDRPNGMAAPQGEIPKDRLHPKSPRVTSDRPNGTATPQGEIPKDRLLPKSPRVTSDRPNGMATPQGLRSRDDEPSSVYVVEESFVHVVIFVFSFMVLLCVKFIMF